MFRSAVKMVGNYWQNVGQQKGSERVGAFLEAVGATVMVPVISLALAVGILPKPTD